MKGRLTSNRSAPRKPTRRHLLESLESRTLLAGDFSPSVDLNLDTDWSEAGLTDRGYDVALQPDGKILVAGVRAKSIMQHSQDMLLARYNNDGSIDTTFNNGTGFAIADFGDGYHDIATAIALQDNGQIVIAGHAIDYHDPPQPDYMYVARFNADGTLDGTFSSVGKGASDVTVLPNGKILVLSNVTNPVDQTNDVKLTRLNSDLTLDTSFGSGGSVVQDYQDTGNSGWGFTVQSDGRILVVGGSSQAGYVTRFLPDGPLDTSYGTDGAVSLDTSVNGRSPFFNVVVNANDEAYIAGASAVSTSGDDREFVVVKLDSAGVLDTSFGVQGIFRYDPTSAEDRAYSIAFDQDGRLVVNGSDGSGGHVIRMHTDGTLDTSFGQNGSVLVPSEGEPVMRGMAVDGVNRIVVAGEKLANTWLVRINPQVEFADSFEEGQGLWVQDGQNDWFTSSQRSTQGSYSAEVDGRATDAELTVAAPIDLSAYAGADLKFSWYIEDGFDSGEYLALDFLDDQGDWNEMLRLRGNVDFENVWHDEIVQLENYAEDYFHDGFQFRFRAKVSSPKEDGNVDNVRLLGTTLAPPPNIIATDDSYEATEDTQLDIDLQAGVLANDTDADGDPLTATLIEGPGDGTVNLNADGSFTYTPNDDFFGSDSFTYKASDGTNESSPATVTIEVTAVNDAPVTVDDSFNVTKDITLDVPAAGVLANDIDVDQDQLTASLSLTIEPTNGQLSFNSDGSFSYTPDAGFLGTDSFTYVANDGADDSNEATVTLIVAASTKFFVVDGADDTTYEYDDAVALRSGHEWNLDGANTKPQGATAMSDGSLVWTIDESDKVFEYDGDGFLQGSWTARKSDSKGKQGALGDGTGIATDDTDIWIVDAADDVAYRYDAAAASRPTGKVAPTDTFSLNAANTDPAGITVITEDQLTTIWIVDSADAVVYEYSWDTTSFQLETSWSLHGDNSQPSGLTIEPGNSNSTGIWVVDNGTDSVYEYDHSTGDYIQAFGLDAANADPLGIADPPPPISGDHAPSDDQTTQLVLAGLGSRPSDVRRSILRIDDQSLAGGVDLLLPASQPELTVNGRRQPPEPFADYQRNIDRAIDELDSLEWQLELLIDEVVSNGQSDPGPIGK